MVKNIRTHFVVFLAMFISSQIEASTIEDVKNLAKNETAVVIKITEILKNLRELLKKGNESLHVPIIDPLLINGQNLSIDETNFRGELTFKSAKIIGLSKYTVDNVVFRFNDSSLQVSIEWPDIELFLSNYALTKAKIMKLFKVGGHGEASVYIKNFKYSINTKIDYNKQNSTFYIEDFNNSIFLGKKGEKDSIKIKLLPNKLFSRILSKALNKNILKFFNSNCKKYENELNSIIQKNVNNYLMTKSLEDITELLKLYKNCHISGHKCKH